MMTSGVSKPRRNCKKGATPLKTKRLDTTNRGFAGASSLHGACQRWRAISFLFLLLCSFGPLSLAKGQVMFAKVPLKAAPEPEVAEFWSVRNAGLHEGFVETKGYLEVQNISRSAIGDAVFYAEYYDAVGRICFSLIFSLDNNGAGSEGPMARNEVRELYSSAYGLSLASKPERVRIQLLRQSRIDQQNSLSRWYLPLRTPVTVDPNPKDNQVKLVLGAETAVSSGPLLDLGLAKVSVDRWGEIQRVEVLGAVSDQVKSWFLNFARELSYYPATENGVPGPGEALVMLRVLLSHEGLEDSPLQPRLSPWVQSYVAGLASSVISPVTTIVFQRPPTRVKRVNELGWIDRPAAPPGVFEAYIQETFWCDSAFAWVRDSSMPQGKRRELRTPGGKQSPN
jgi:hypothetical protein